MTRLLPESEFAGFYDHVENASPDDVDDLIECWKGDQEQMLEDLDHKQLLQLLFLSVHNKPCELTVLDYASDVVTRKPSGV